MFDELTKKEKQVYLYIVLNGLTRPEIAKKLGVKITTINTHVDNICTKFCFDGDNRILKLVIDYYFKVSKGDERMRNCEECQFCANKTCKNPKSQYAGDVGKANKGQLCREFKEKNNAKLH